MEDIFLSPFLNIEKVSNTYKNFFLNNRDLTEKMYACDVLAKVGPRYSLAAMEWKREAFPIYSKLLVKAAIDENAPRELLVDCLRRFAKSNATRADVLREYGLEEHEVLDIMQSLNRPVETVLPVKNVYKDRQNVHNKFVNKSIMSSAQYILKNFEKRGFIHFCFDRYARVYRMDVVVQYTFVKTKCKKTDSVVNRIIRDTHGISIGNRSITLLDMYELVCGFILTSQHRDDLIKILKKQLKDSYEICWSGLFSRIISTLCGFDDYIIIRIDNFYREIINNNLKKYLPEELVIDFDGEKFKNFLLENEEKLLENVDEKEEGKKYLKEMIETK